MSRSLTELERKAVRAAARDLRKQRLLVSSALEFELRRELGQQIAPTAAQLELDLPALPVSATARFSRLFTPKPTCGECGRRGYHLKSCAQGGH